ncbi:hypothetical protein [Variovorax sp. DAIF25]|uniref:hypothetical protein n=1 Tax=Variovorax sp. DAIF25 TaxID=3080983 RepID=UPI003D6A1000
MNRMLILNYVRSPFNMIGPKEMALLNKPSELPLILLTVIALSFPAVAEARKIQGSPFLLEKEQAPTPIAYTSFSNKLPVEENSFEERWHPHFQDSRDFIRATF